MKFLKFKKNGRLKGKWLLRNGGIEEYPISVRKKIIRGYVRTKFPFPNVWVPAGDTSFEDWLNSMGYMSYGWDAKLNTIIRGRSKNIAAYVKKKRKEKNKIFLKFGV